MGDGGEEEEERGWKGVKNKREVLRLQQFYNKSWVVSYYWFKFEFRIEITFLTQQEQPVTTCHLRFVVKLL